MTIGAFPQLSVHPQSGLTVPWTEHIGSEVQTVWSASFGPDGVGEGMSIYVYWNDLEQALQELLGYSYRVAGTHAVPRLSRVLPWQSPQFNQLFVQRVQTVKGLVLAGKSKVGAPPGGGVGPGGQSNFGPHAIYDFAQITVQFWRPPYFVLSDKAITVGGKQREWLRYVDKKWEPDIQILQREGMTWKFCTGQDPASGQLFRGSVGQKITRYGVKRTWYQIPEAAVFQVTADTNQPNGLPYNLMYTQSAATNPITAMVYNPASPVGACVNLPIGGGVDDSNAANRLFGCYMGTLLYLIPTLQTRDLQLPPALMRIPSIQNNEALSQTQYDVTLHFDVFDPPRSDSLVADATVLPSGAKTNEAFRGHNLMPWPGDGRWYAVQSQSQVPGAAQKASPFDYADLSELFQIL